VNRQTQIEAVLTFWFGEEGPEAVAPDATAARWFQKDEAFDETIRTRFGDLYEAARTGALDGWASTARGRLALLIVLDQFPRNLFRGTRRAFESDARALALASEGVALGHDRAFAVDGRSFFYMPLMHAEDRLAQQRCVDLFTALRDEMQGVARDRAERSLDFAIRHRDIVERFGRFPHRNQALGRTSTPEELAFLKEPGSSF